MVVHASQHASVLPTPSPRGQGEVFNAQMVEERFLWPSMDGTVLNRRQFDPSPEADSELEFLRDALLARDVDTALVHTDRLMELNRLEGGMFARISKTADSVAVSMRNVRAAGPVPSGRQLVARLSGPLGQLVADPGNAEAAAEVRAAIEGVPVPALQSKQLFKQLRKRKMEALFRVMGAMS